MQNNYNKLTANHAIKHFLTVNICNRWIFSYL